MKLLLIPLLFCIKLEVGSTDDAEFVRLLLLLLLLLSTRLELSPIEELEEEALEELADDVSVEPGFEELLLVTKPEVDSTEELAELKASLELDERV